jgi:hypothetical protein
MAIDPVLLLVDELRENEKRLVREAKLQNAAFCAQRTKTIVDILQRVRALYDQLIETAPTSAIGSSELIRIAGQRMPFSHARYARHLDAIADRLADGKRYHSDLVWIRALADALATATADGEINRTVTLLLTAIRGAAMPVLVHHDVHRRPDLNPTLEDLTRALASRPTA